MSLVAGFLLATECDNTHRSYASAIHHFKVARKGMLPASTHGFAAPPQSGGNSPDSERHPICPIPHQKNGPGLVTPVPSVSRAGVTGNFCTGIRCRIINWLDQIGASALSANSLAPLLRGLFQNAGLTSAQQYSGHSLHRSFVGRGQ